MQYVAISHPSASARKRRLNVNSTNFSSSFRVSGNHFRLSLVPSYFQLGAVRVLLACNNLQRFSSNIFRAT